jgi:hypothetical protein
MQEMQNVRDPLVTLQEMQEMQQMQEMQNVRDPFRVAANQKISELEKDIAIKQQILSDIKRALSHFPDPQNHGYVQGFQAPKLRET